MGILNLIKRKKIKEQQKQKGNQQYIKAKDEISKNLSENINYIKNLLVDNDDIIYREFYSINGKKVCLIFIDGLINREIMDKGIVAPLMIESQKIEYDIEDKKIYEIILNRLLATSDLKEQKNMKDAILDILSGDSILFIDGEDRAIRISCKGWANRGVQQPALENTVRGPRDSFNETVRINTMAIRRRVRDINLRVKNMKIGRRSQTDVYIIYIEDIVDRDVLNEVFRRLEKIDIDAIFDVGMIEQLIEDSYLSLFPSIQSTERPDEAVSAIYEGRVVILCDNSNMALVLPATLNTFIQTSEDYYERWYISSFIRIVRVIALILAMTLQGLYIAIASYSPNMIPPELGLFVAATREGVPFPVYFEVLFLEIMMEILREAGIRLPGPIGQTIGIVGGLIIGQAAVQAGLIAPIVVILVATTAIASFAIPNYNFAIGLRLNKFLFIIAGTILGLYGFILMLILVLSNLVIQKSFGVPYLSPFVSLEILDYKDSIVRLPTRFLWARPIFANTKQKIRLLYQRSDPPQR